MILACGDLAAKIVYAPVRVKLAGGGAGFQSGYEIQGSL